METLTNSRAKAYRRCPRYHRNRYEELRSPAVDAQPLRFGKLIDRGVQAWDQWTIDGGERFDNERLPNAIASMSTLIDTVDPYDYAAAVALLTGYHVRWLYEAVEPVLTQHRFTLPLINPDTGHASRTWRVSGVWDGLVIVDREPATDGHGSRPGRYMVKELKTSSEDISPGSDYWRRLRMDSQVSTYFAAAKALNYDPHGVLYDVIKKPTSKPYKETPDENKKYTDAKPARPGKPCKGCKSVALYQAKERGEKLLVKDIPYKRYCDECTPPKDAEPPRLYSNLRPRDETPREYGLRIGEAIAAEPERWYQRGTVVRLPADERAFAFDLWALAKSMREDKSAIRNPDACVQWSRTCEYFDVCTNAASLDDDSLFRDRHKHPELEEASEHSGQGDKRSA